MSVLCRGVMCPHLTFPYLVCFLSLLMSLLVNSCPAVFGLIIYDLPVYISSCLFRFDVVWSTCYSRCILFVSTALSCHVLP